MPYDNQTTYAKFQDGCGDKSKKEGCSCCDPGLIAVYDDCGKHLGCVSPNDAQIFNTAMIKCAEGYMKLINPADGMFLGCVSPADALAYLATLE